MIMQTFDALWRVFLHASIPARLAIGVVAVLAVNRLAWIPDDVSGWLSDRYRLEGMSWRVWRARVRRQPFGPGARVLCLDGAYGVVIGRVGCDRHLDCPQAAIVGFEVPGVLPRIVPLAELVKVPPLDGGQMAASMSAGDAR